MAGVLGVGWALPRLAIKAEEYRRALGAFAGRGVQEKTVAPFDEDELTLGVEAGERALSAAQAAPSQIGYLAFASVGARPGAAALLSVSLGTPSAAAVDFLGSGPPFAAALQAAAEFAEGSGREALVVAADALRGRVNDPAEHPLGAGAGALLLSKNGPVQLVKSAFACAAAMAGSRVGPDGLVGSYPGDDPSGPALRMAVEGLLGSGFPADSFDLVAGPERSGASMVASHLPRGAGAAAAGGPLVLARTGDTGAAAAALALIVALETAESDDQLLLGDAEGSSGAAFALKVGRRPKGEESFRSALGEGRVHLSWHAYLGHRRYLPDPSPTTTKSEGAYVSAAAWEETLEARLRLVASRCQSCGTVRHPPREPCPDCGGLQLDVFCARPQGAVHAATRISRGGAPSEFALQQGLVGEYAVVTVDLVDGGRAVAQVALGHPSSPSIGQAVTLRVRRLFEQEGRVRYGLKAVPASTEATRP